MRYLILTALLAMPFAAISQESDTTEEKPLVFELDLTKPTDERQSFRCEDAVVIKQPAPVFSQQSDAMAIHQQLEARHIDQINRRTLKGCR
ncbi:MAG: hypothetical protein AAGH74_02945 [Pseudomonadota bacterium]